MIESRAELPPPLPPKIKNTAIMETTKVNAQADKMARRLLRERFGRQGGWVWLQAPSELGPSSHGPPAIAERRHSQRSPSLAGTHSLVPPQRPVISGPYSHGLFQVAARPQRNLCVGRS
jgi:hypothetical protein